MPAERRPHWDDELIEAVLSEVTFDGTSVSRLFDAEAYAVIAAVEDWHKAKRDHRVRTHSAECWRWHTECAEAMIEHQQAAIQRVRKLHRPRMGSRYYVCAECGPNISYPCHTRSLVDDEPWGFLRATGRGESDE